MGIEEVPFSELLGEVIDNRGKTCPTADVGIPLIATNCIRNELLYPTHEKVRFVSQDTYSTWFRGHPKPGDILFVNKATPGRVCLVPDPLDFCIAQDMVAVRANPKKIYPKFLFAVLRSPTIQEKIGQMHVGTLIPHFKKGDFDKLLLPVPSRDAQEFIGDIYFELSAKIDLNRRMNETLEAMARAIFKSWFIDFDPVRAKGEGRDPNLPKHIADLFPDSFEDSVLGEIPNGWRCSYLGEVAAKIGSGATPRGGGSVYVADGVALIRSQNVYDSLFVWDGLARITDAAADTLQGVTVEREDVLLNITGASILRTCVVDPDVLPARVNQHVCIIRPKPGIPSRYIHFYLLQPSTKSFLMGMDAGASRQAVTKGHIESVPLVIPPEPVLDMFANLVGPLFRATSNNKSQSRSLASIRDALSPKLISGEIRVKNSECEAGRSELNADASRN